MDPKPRRFVPPAENFVLLQEHAVIEGERLDGFDDARIAFERARAERRRGVLASPGARRREKATDRYIPR